MNIEIGKYIIKSDPQCMWIEEKVTMSKENGEIKEYYRRASGYCTNFQHLLENFSKNRILRSDAKTVKELLEDLTMLENDLYLIAAGLEKKAVK